MRVASFLLGFLAVTLSSFAAEFPPPEGLPAHPALPDPLVMCDGSRISTKGDWAQKRAPELRALFEHYMYGRRPEKGRVLEAGAHVSDHGALDGAATLREYGVPLSTGGVVQLLVVTPNGKSVPVPCFLGLNFHGNHQVLAHPGIALPKSWVRPNKDGTGGQSAREEDRGREADAWNVAQIIQRGYAFATFFQSDVVPDDARLAEPVLRKLGGVAGDERGPADTATIMAWAWGFSRMLDLLERIPEVDGRRVAVVGPSRNGKTALLAAAFDERIAMAIPSQAGCGGTAPSRVPPELAAPRANGRPTAETVAVINRAFPHWFCGNFKAFGEAPEKLPFDQHELIALCAPRPVLLSCAVEDLWANPAGQFEMLKAADPVYKLVAGDGLGAATVPEAGKLLDSRLGYFIRPGRHSMNGEDWKAWLDYADKWLR